MAWEPGYSAEDDDVQAMRCCNGHAIRKLKRELRPWQLSTRHCDHCGDKILRHEAHWRCEHHCRFNVCTVCYDAHRERELARCQERRRQAIGRAQDVAARKFVGAGVSSGQAGLHRSAIAVAGAAVCLTMEPLARAAESVLMQPSAPIFPFPWLIAGTSLAIAWIICRLAQRAASRHCAALVQGPEEPLKLAPVLGALRGLEVGFALVALQNLSATGLSGVWFLLVPILTFVGVGCMRMEQPSKTACLAVLLSAVGGFLMVATALLETFKDGSERTLADRASVSALVSQLSAAALQAVQALLHPSSLCACVLAAVRYVFTQRWFAGARTDELPSPVLLGGKMLFPAAIICLEIAFWFESKGFEALMAVPGGMQGVGLFFAIAICLAMQVVTEIGVVQMSSAVFLGLLAPMHGAAAHLLGSLLQGEKTSRAQWASIVLSVLACALYLKQRLGGEMNAREDLNGYRRLEAGAYGGSGSMPPRPRKPHPQSFTEGFSSGSGSPWPGAVASAPRGPPNCVVRQPQPTAASAPLARAGLPPPPPPPVSHASQVVAHGPPRFG